MATPKPENIMIGTESVGPRKVPFWEKKQLDNLTHLKWKWNTARILTTTLKTAPIIRPNPWATNTTKSDMVKNMERRFNSAGWSLIK